MAVSQLHSGLPIARRDLLQVGSLGLMGLTMPALLRQAAAGGLRPGAAKSCLLFFLDEDPHTANINAFTEDLAADSDKAFDMLMRRF